MLFGVCFYIVLLLQPKIPQAVSLIPVKQIVNQATDIAPVNLKTIYEDDIFKTHISNLLEPGALNPITDIPLPPPYQEIGVYQVDTPLFLDPLPITITGIMTFGNEELNRIIIRDNRNQTEQTYQIGDDLEDAQIVRILRNKVIIIRSNSQQETLFLREQDAILDLDTIEPNWDDLIKQINEHQYQINTLEFGNQIKSLGKLVDLLNLITAYKAGQNTGIKIGTNATNPLVKKLGLQSGDVILTVNDLGTDTTASRLAIYNLAMETTTKSLLAKILRNNREITIEYLLVTTTPITNEPDNVAEVLQHVTKNRSSFEAVADKLKDKDRNYITQFKNKISQSVSR